MGGLGSHAALLLDGGGEVRRSFGGTVNDVVLTAVAGGFRPLLADHGGDVDHAVVRTLVRAGRDPGRRSRPQALGGQGYDGLLAFRRHR